LVGSSSKDPLFAFLVRLLISLDILLLLAQEVLLAFLLYLHGIRREHPFHALRLTPEPSSYLQLAHFLALPLLSSLLLQLGNLCLLLLVLQLSGGDLLAHLLAGRVPGFLAKECKTTLTLSRGHFHTC